VQASWSFGAIEQHGDARGTGTDVDNDASPASKIWASIGSKLAHLKASADNNSVGVLNHHQNFSIMKTIVLA
jgi:creatinine amidohydrolase/Fe(II)-dependent formamide hydrolase-like protein